MPSPIDTLTSINLDDLVASFGWQMFPAGAAALRTVFRGMAEKFARQIIGFDDAIAVHGLTEAARQMSRQYLAGIRVYGRANLPKSGPVLVLANHPGMADTLALFSTIQRDDLRIIALARPFLQAMPNTTRHLYFISEEADASKRVGAIKQTAAHLRNGGAVLTFPAGTIEPDAAVYDGALEALGAWVESAGVLLRFAPQTSIVPAFVRGVLWERTAKHPLTRLKRARAERERLAAAFQLIAHIGLDLKPVTVTVQFGAPISVEMLGTTDVSAIHARVLEEMRRLIEAPITDPGESVI